VKSPAPKFTLKFTGTLTKKSIPGGVFGEIGKPDNGNEYCNSAKFRIFISFSSLEPNGPKEASSLGK
jgi:hypothetical protein